MWVFPTSVQKKLNIPNIPYLKNATRGMMLHTQKQDPTSSTSHDRLILCHEGKDVQWQSQGQQEK